MGDRIMKHVTWGTLFAFAASFAAVAQVKTETVEYNVGGVLMEGYLAYDATLKGRQPAVIIVHEWWGINDYIRKRAEQVAGLGYVAFAADMYGKGNRATTAQEAGALSSALLGGDRKVARERIRGALDTLLKNELVDPKRVAVMGYCFGGTVALECARGGAEIAAAASFHGGLGTPNPAEAKNIRARIIAFHGADDTFVPPAQVAAFEEEMRKGGVDWQLVSFGDAVHSFTNPASGNDKTRGAAYNEKADRRSWEYLKVFLKEAFGQ
jgi:dienelactone hydrolase